MATILSLPQNGISYDAVNRLSNDSFIHFRPVFFYILNVREIYRKQTLKTFCICSEISHGSNPTINE